MKVGRFLLILGLILSVLWFASAALAEGDALTLPWWTVDNGGGSSAGEGFALVGTLGQAEAGGMSGGSYELSGGFFPGPPDAPPPPQYRLFLPQALKP